ncbi:MAG: Type 1 glutamine amidotransferase-like domain-containing protein [Ignavibacteriae bacterium]|nr:Type 1 glutamine amidotransferase-like domain-containing protein [Ignavibacteriota bacterium]
MSTNIFKTILIFFIFYNSIYSQGYICAIGGGSEDYNDWSDKPYSWIVEKSNFGKVLVLSVNSETNWIPNYFISFGADTSYNLMINSKSKANLQSNYDEIISAKAIFIKGGDQWDYVRFWKGTKVDSAINYVFQNGGVIAGTSAGAAVLGESDFSAKNGTVYSDEALQDPFNNYMQFEASFLNFAQNVIFDSHLTERARQGRLFTFLFNNFFSGKDLLGIGIDDRTALGISPDGITEVFGSGSVLFVTKDEQSKYFQYDSTLTIDNLRADLLIDGWKYNIDRRRIETIPNSAKEISMQSDSDIIKNKIILISGNEINQNAKKNILAESQELLNKNILIISNNGFSENSEIVNNFLDSCGFTSTTIYISEDELNSNVFANKINEAQVFIFYGDSLDLLSKLGNPEFIVSEAFQNSVKQNKTLMFIGDCGKIISEKFVDYEIDDIYASYYGRMNLKQGLNLTNDFVYQPSIFVNSDYFENNMSAVFYNQMRNKKKYGIYVDGNDKVTLDFENSNLSGNCKTPFIIIDATETTHIDSSKYKASSNSGTRQIVALNNLRISLTNNSNFQYSLINRNFGIINSINVNDEILKKNIFTLEQNYPNPFNPNTTINYSIPNVGSDFSLSNATLKVYDILGREVAELVNQKQNPGNYKIQFDGRNLPSGIYFYTLHTNNFSITKSMVLLK